MTAVQPQAGRVTEALILFVLFFGPVFLALVAYLGPWEIIPDRSTAHGILIEPTRALPSRPLVGSSDGNAAAQRLTGRWFLIYRAADGCDAACIGRLDTLGQVHTALAEDRIRVQRVLLYPGTAAAPRAEGWLLIPLQGEAAGELAVALAAAHPGPIYVSDPRGNLVLAYPRDANGEGILKDLERLLRLSRIG